MLALERERERERESTHRRSKRFWLKTGLILLLTLLAGAGALLSSLKPTGVAAGARGLPASADQIPSATSRAPLLGPFHPLQDVTFDARRPFWNGQPIQVEHRLARGRWRPLTIGTFTFNDVVIPAEVTVRFQGFDVVVFQSTGDLEINGVMDVSGGNGQPGVRDGGGQGGNGGASRGGAPEGGEPGEGGHPWTSVQRRADPENPYDFVEGQYGALGEGDVAGCGPAGGEAFDIPLTQLKGGGSGAGGGNGTRGADGQGHILDGIRPEFGKRGQSEVALQQQSSIRVDRSLGGEPFGEPVFSTDPDEWCSASGGAGGDGMAMLIRRRLAGGGGGGGGAGGAIFLNAQGTIRINRGGAVRANGGNGGDGTRGTFSGGGGGGAGGFIRIEAQMLEMNGGLLEARGGRGGRGQKKAPNGGAGGGGRIVIVGALQCTPLATPPPSPESITCPVTDLDGRDALGDQQVGLPTVVAPQEELRIVSIQWMEFISRLDNNPNAGGGTRIFPEKHDPTDDPVPNRKVQVRAVVRPAMAGVTVFFKSFDVDDPSSDKAPIDPNGSKGDDNNGFPKVGMLDQTNAQTTSEGVATVTFTVTTKPGDNFKVAAAVNQSILDSLMVEGMEIIDIGTGRALQPQPASGDRAVATKMLTVWRTLHIEVDDMGIVMGNDQGGGVILDKRGNTLTLDRKLPDQEDRFENGRIQITATTAEFELTGRASGMNASASPSSLRLTVNSVTAMITPQANASADDVMQTLAVEAQRQGLRLSRRDGRIVVASVNGQVPMTAEMVTSDTGLQVTRSTVFPRDDDSFEVAGNDVQAQSRVTLKRDSPRKRDSFNRELEFAGFLYTSLVDDDDFNENDAGRLRGDMGEDVTGLDLSLIQETDSPEGNVFAPAYIRPAYDLSGNETNVMFVLNSPGTCPASGVDRDLPTIYSFDNRLREDDENFWTVYLFGAYQDCSHTDGDPQKTEPNKTTGRVDAFNGGEGAVVFLEVMRRGEVPLSDVVNRAITAAHEIGHLFGGDHGEGGLMAEARNRGRNDNRFSERTIATLRNAGHP